MPNNLDNAVFDYKTGKVKKDYDQFAEKLMDIKATVTLPPKDYVYMTMLHSAYMMNIHQALVIDQLVSFLDKVAVVSHSDRAPTHGQVKHYRALRESPDVKRALVLARKVKQNTGVFFPVGERLRQGREQ